MRKGRKKFLGLGISLAFLGLLVYFVLNFSPDKNFSILSFSLPTLPIFFLIFFVAIYEFFAFVFNNQLRGFLIGFFATLYLILRFYKLTNPFFALLIIALFITFELLFRKRK